MSLAIANKLMNDGVGVLYMSYREVITYIKQNIIKIDINIIFEIVNYRYFNNLPMIISCEKNIDDLLDIDEAICSRLVEMSKKY